MPGVGKTKSLRKLMKQASRLQKDMEEMQATLASRTVEATSGGGAVRVTAGCDRTLKSIKIDPQAVNAEEIGLLEDMVLAAVNSALQQSSEVHEREMRKLNPNLSEWIP